MIHIRRAGALDAGPMSELLNAIIAKGGTTAFTTPVSRDIVAGWMRRDPDRSAWHLAEDAAGHCKGYQLIEPHPDLPPEACDIASFVRIGQTGIGIGSALFEASKSAARQLGYRWINATIRADNTGGLAYYQSRGFERYATHPNQTLDSGQTVDKVSKRFDLK